MSQIPISSANRNKRTPKRTPGPGQVTELRDERNKFSATSLQWLDMIIRAVNRNPDKVGLTRPLTTKDLDTLTPEQLKKILIFLLCGAGECEESDFYPRRFEQLDLEHRYKAFLSVAFDPNMSNLYWRVKNLFADYDDTFDYSVLYFPSMDPKRTKAVLRYVMCYVLFVETINEKFEDTMNQCLTDVRELTETQAEIELLQTQINAKIVQLEEWENEIPSLKVRVEAEIKSIDAHLRKLEQLEMKIKLKSKEFEAYMMENVAVECKIKSIEAKIRDEEQKLVINPSVTLQKHSDEKELLNRALLERAALSAKREKLAEDDNFTTKIIEDAIQCVSELEEFVAKMQNSVEFTENVIKSEKQHRILRLRAEDAKVKAEKTKALREKTKIQHAEIRQNKEIELNKKRAKLEHLKKQLETLKSLSEEKSGTVTELVAIETSALANIHKIQSELSKTMEYVNVTLPNAVEEVNAKSRAAIEELTSALKMRVVLFNAGEANRNNNFDDTKSKFNMSKLPRRN